MTWIDAMMVGTIVLFILVMIWGSDCFKGGDD